MAKIQLVYFPVRGRGESIRTLLVDNNVDYEEVDVLPRENWVNNWKPKMAFGQCPFLKDGDVELVQSNTILRYLARKLDLYGADNKEASRADMINDGTEDLRVAYTKMIYQNYEEGKGPFIEELPGKLTYFENLMQNGDYILGSKICFADYNLFDLLDCLVTLSPPCLDNFPKLKAYYGRMMNRPGVQKRRSTEHFKGMKINGNGKQ
ncbi:glutathione S-transferase P 1-like [Ostrea edulis]|uniref:glutathione S-transferase P 1-like n=1 Tax=Ostrea edulis TaxID=37623 RepID=UPI0020964758|nr:glutathione S-transferase P 1-like [Ostrea edulis]XP_056016528.1 glutathione S-transferase P 1-like [Ostrea edulis]XP_056016529.1 glutathione S-transferase P 1-like [Ostrea edulis]